MDPITATGIISIGKELFDQAISPSSRTEKGSLHNFSDQIENTQNKSAVVSDPNLRIQKLENDLRSDLQKDPITSTFFQQNKSSQIFLERRADGSVQFISSSGQSLVIEKDSPHCSKANEILDMCFDNRINLTSMRPNAVSFNS